MMVVDEKHKDIVVTIIILKKGGGEIEQKSHLIKSFKFKRIQQNYFYKNEKSQY